MCFSVYSQRWKHKFSFLLSLLSSPSPHSLSFTHTHTHKDPSPQKKTKENLHKFLHKIRKSLYVATSVRILCRIFLCLMLCILCESVNNVTMIHNCMFVSAHGLNSHNYIFNHIDVFFFFSSWRSQATQSRPLGR